MPNLRKAMPDRTEPPIEVQIGEVGRQLAQSFQRLLDGTESRPSAPKDVARTYGMNAVFAQRLAAALKRTDPLATLQQIPGPEPLRRLIEAARKKGVPEPLLEQATAANDAFQHIIRHVAGDRSGLDAIIAAWLPEARARIDNDAKQSAYRGMRQLKGIAANTVFFTCFIHPGGPGQPRHDQLILRGHMGLRCVRPGAPLTLSIRTGSTRPTPVESIGGVSVRENPRSILIDEFCCGLPLELSCHEIGDAAVYTFDWGDAVGISSARDIVLGELTRGFFRPSCPPDSPRPRSGVTHGISVPAAVYFFDMILHKDVFPGRDPKMRVLELGESGAADPNDESREFEGLDTTDTVDPMGIGFQRLRTQDIPNYVELLEHACRKLGWNPAEMRCYRTRIEYPIFGSQVRMAFDLPIEAS